MKRPVGIFVAVMAMVASLVVATSSPASATVSIKRGYGILVQGHWFGSYLNGGRIMYCVSPNSGLSAGQSVSTVSTWSHIGKTRSEEVEYILNRYGNTHSKTDAAGVYDALNRIVGNNSATFKSWEKHAPISVRNLAAAYVSRAARYHGPYRVSVKATPVLVGQTGTLTVTLKSAAGYGLSGRIGLVATNATVAKTVTTASNGVVRVHFTRTGTGTVKFSARGLSLPPTTMVFSHPARGQQQLLSWSPSVNTGWASTAFQKSAASPAASYACSTTCNGRPPVSITICHAAYEATAEYFVYGNGHVVKTLTVGRSSKATCTKVSTLGSDREVVSYGRRYLVGTRWSSVEKFGTPFTIDCPPWPVVSETLSCNCAGGNIVLSLAKNVTTHVEAINYSVNGGAQVHKTVNPGDTLVVTIPFDRTKGDTDVVFNGAIQRTGGSWNIGGDEEVIVRKI